jgi:transcriptional regulator with XRE-family HTH domain
MEKKQRKSYLMKPAQQYLTLERAAKVEGVSPRTIYRRLQEGKTPFVIVDGQTWISLPEQKVQKPRIDDFRKYKGEEISLREAARRSGIPAETISQWHRTGKIPSMKKGQYVLLALDHFMYAQALYKYVKAVRGSTSGIDIFRYSKSD